MDPYYAHTAEDQKGKNLPENWQLLSDHLNNVSMLAGEFAKPLDLEKEAFLAGLIHDLGKYRKEFQEYLDGSRGKSSDTQHAIYGAAFNHYIRSGAFRAITNVIASHHSGINNEDDTFTGKIKKYTSGKSATEVLKKLHSALVHDGLTIPTEDQLPTIDEPNGAPVDAELRRRMLLSCLVDADYLDTEKHFLSAKGQERPDAKFSSIQDFLNALNQQFERFDNQKNKSPLNELRSKLATESARRGSSTKPGVFTLAAPTGSGKTLNSAAFALNHAIKNGFKRVIYVIPYTSIIEQNASVFADLFGKGNVLEHHSLANWRSADEDEGQDEFQIRFRLASENWDAPFIVTTNVQFFESLHSHRPSAVRKLHRLMNSVVIFDECQTFPPKILDVTLETLKALLDFGKTSLVFCTATQPALEQRPNFPFGFEATTPITPPEWKISTLPEFSRTRFTYNEAPVSKEALASTIARKARVLAIVNTTRNARELAIAIAKENPDQEIYHLSARMCPAHRQEILAAVRLRLNASRCGCILIATQLVEAGVDIDFPHVYREIGPLDSILQAAGRCNREGKLTNKEAHPQPGQVEIFHLEDSRLPPDAAYRQGTELAAKYLKKMTDGIIPDEFVTDYFKELYHDSNRDGKNLRMLRKERLFRTLGEQYRWIDENEPSESVLCDYGETGTAWLAILRSQGPIPLSRHQHRSIAHYCVNMRESEIRKGREMGTINELPCGQSVTANSYDTRFGLSDSTKNTEINGIL
jgi:CRISPR-associated endonuclease/helicase Cas3